MITIVRSERLVKSRVGDHQSGCFAHVAGDSFLTNSTRQKLNSKGANSNAIPSVKFSLRLDQTEIQIKIVGAGNQG